MLGWEFLKSLLLLAKQAQHGWATYPHDVFSTWQSWTPTRTPGPPRSSAFATVYLAGLLQRLSTVKAEGWQAAWQMRGCRSRAVLAKITMREGELSRVRVFKGHP